MATETSDNEQLRVERSTFDNILEKISNQIKKEPMNMKPNPMTAECQLALTLYPLVHACSLTRSDYIGRLVWTVCIEK